MTERDENLTVVDLFCGAGGFSEGFKQMGFKIKYAVDDWKPARETFRKNFPEAEVPEESTDILDIDIEDIPSADVIIGGPPCTYFSMSNMGGNGDVDEGMRLVMKFLRIIDEKDPDYWIMENVPRLEPSLKEEIEDDVLELPSGSTLDIPKVKEYIASNFGAPQKRKRLFSGDYPDIGSDKLGFKEEVDSKSMRGVIEILPYPLDIEKGKGYADPLYDEISLKGSDLTDQNYNTFLTKHEWIDSRKNKEEHRFYGKMRFPDLTVNHFEVDPRPSRTITAFVVKSGRETIAIKDKRWRFRLDLKDYEDYLGQIDFGERKLIDKSLFKAFEDNANKVSPQSIVSRLKKVRNPIKEKEWWKDDYEKDKPFEEVRDRWWVKDDDMTYLLEADEDKGRLNVYQRRHKSAGYRIPTIREIASIQSFPITFQFHADSFSKKHRLVGNAVPPLLARKFARAILMKEYNEDPLDDGKSGLTKHSKIEERAYESDVDSPHRGEHNYRYNRKFVDFIGEKSNSSRKGCRVDIENQGEKPIHPIYEDDEIKHTVGWRCRLYTGYADTVKEKDIDFEQMTSLIKHQDEEFISKTKEMATELVKEGKERIPDSSTYQAFFTTRNEDLFHSPYWLTNILNNLVNKHFDDEELRRKTIEDTGDEIDLRNEIEMEVGIAAKMLAGIFACEILNSGTYWMIENWDQRYEKDEWPEKNKPDESQRRSGCEEMIKKIKDI